MKKQICFPARVVIAVGVILVLASYYGSYRYGWNKGDNQYACFPDVNFDSYYMDCFKASFASGVSCPCNRDFEATYECLDILDNRAFTQEQKKEKVAERFGEKWAIELPITQSLTIECEDQGLCPAGKCVSWAGGCKQRADDFGRDTDKCCLSVIPD